MATITYTGFVRSRNNRKLPFVVEVVASDGRLAAQYSVRTKAEGDAKLAETIGSLKAALSKLPRKH